MKLARLFCSLSLCMAVFLSLVGSAMAKTEPIERCAEVPLPEGFDPKSVATVQQAFEGAPRLFFALGRSRHALLKQRLSEGENPNVCAFNVSVLAVSAASGDLEEVGILLDGGADPNKPLNANGGTPLLDAIGAGHADIAQLLLTRGADARRATDGGLTALHQLAMAAGVSDEFLPLAKRLMDAGLDVNARLNVPKTTPLMLAAVRGNQPLVALLLRSGAQAELTNARGQTALSLAQQKGHREIIALLLAASKTSTAPAPTSAPTPTPHR